MADKSNEITAVPELLGSFDLAGCIVTTDASVLWKSVLSHFKKIVII